MPTRAQMEELTANTTYQWVTNYKGSGINGGTFTATNGAVLFLPATGIWVDGGQDGVGDYCWCYSSSPGNRRSAFILSILGEDVEVFTVERMNGCSVRPVVG